MACSMRSMCDGAGVSIGVTSGAGVSIGIGVTVTSGTSAAMAGTLPITHTAHTASHFVIFFNFSYPPYLTGSEAQQLQFFISGKLFNLIFTSHRFFFC